MLNILHSNLVYIHTYNGFVLWIPFTCGATRNWDGKNHYAQSSEHRLNRNPKITLHRVTVVSSPGKCQSKIQDFPGPIRTLWTLNKKRASPALFRSLTSLMKVLWPSDQCIRLLIGRLLVLAWCLCNLVFVNRLCGRHCFSPLPRYSHQTATIDLHRPITWLPLSIHSIQPKHFACLALQSRTWERDETCKTNSTWPPCDKCWTSNKHSGKWTKCPMFHLNLAFTRGPAVNQENMALLRVISQGEQFQPQHCAA